MTQINDEPLGGIYRCRCGFPHDVPHFLIETPGQAYVVFCRTSLARFDAVSPSVAASWYMHNLTPVSWSQLVVACGGQADQIRSDIRKFFEEKTCD